MRPVRLAVLGATGLVGQTTLAVLEEWGVPLTELRLYASSSSVGKTMKCCGRLYEVRSMDGEEVDADYAILALSAEHSRVWAPQLVARGIRVIDHSSAFRMNDDVPLVIPEINADIITSETRVVANPNCSASVVVMALAPLDRRFGLRRALISTYQSVSGAGSAAVEELREQNRNDNAKSKALPRRIAGNLFPEVGHWESSGYSGEETKIGSEIKKILNRERVHVSATAVRVPVEIGHAASVSVELLQETSMADVMKCLSDFPGLICDGSGYATPLEVSGQQDVHVGRVRIDPDDNHWLHFWVVGDNLRKGAASNAIQILQFWSVL